MKLSIIIYTIHILRILTMYFKERRNDNVKKNAKLDEKKCKHNNWILPCSCSSFTSRGTLVPNDLYVCVGFVDSVDIVTTMVMMTMMLLLVVDNVSGT